jgi:hypothetical protein
MLAAEAQASGDYPGDLRDRALDEPNALAGLLARPFIYVRGPLGAFVDRIDEAAAESTKDAIVACLMAPPRSSAEPDLVPAVARAYRGGAALDETTRNAHRLHDLLAAQPFLERTWPDRIDDASSATELASLRSHLERAHLSAPPRRRARRSSSTSSTSRRAPAPSASSTERAITSCAWASSQSQTKRRSCGRAVASIPHGSPKRSAPTSRAVFAPRRQRAPAANSRLSTVAHAALFLGRWARLGWAPRRSSSAEVGSPWAALAADR